MREVSVRILHFLHEIARAAEVDEASLYEGFPAPAPREARHARGILGAHARRRADRRGVCAHRRSPPREAGDGRRWRARSGWPQRLELSKRQRDVFALVVEGRANRELATLLGCSERNVEFHVGRILRAARVASRSELLVKVLRSG